ncbi:unnamed protein product [Urochloa decumbens]
MVLPSASTDQELKLEVYGNIPRAFHWVMVATSSSSSLTIGEHNKNKNVSRAAAWLTFVCLPSFFIAGSAASAYIMHNKPIWGAGFPWYLPVVMLWGIYMAVVQLAMWHLILFLPQAPFDALEALQHICLEKIGIAATITSVPALFFDHACMLWSFLVGVLIAAIIAFWICLVRMYGNWRSVKGGLARGLAVSSFLTAAMVVILIRLVQVYGE